MSDLSRLLDDVYRSGTPAAAPTPAKRPALEEAFAEWEATEPEPEGDGDAAEPMVPAARTALEEAFADWEDTEPVAAPSPEARTALEEAFADWDEPEPPVSATPARSALEAALAELEAVEAELAAPPVAAPATPAHGSTPGEVDQLQELLDRLQPLAGPDADDEDGDGDGDEPALPAEALVGPAPATPVDTFLADIDTLLAEPPVEPVASAPVAVEPAEKVLPPSPELAEALQSVLHDAVRQSTTESDVEPAPARLEEVAMDAGDDAVEPAFVPPLPVQGWCRQDDDILPLRGRRLFSLRR